MQTGIAHHGLLADSSLPSRFPIAPGWCSPALPTKLYERSNPSGPSTFISQLSLARDPTIDTRHSPGLPLSTCSMRATISPRVRGSPVFCISILTGMSPILYKAARETFHAHNRSKIRWTARCVADNVGLQAFKERSGAIAVPATEHLLKWSFTISAEESPGRMIVLRTQTCGAPRALKKAKAVTLVML